MWLSGHERAALALAELDRPCEPLPEPSARETAAAFHKLATGHVRAAKRHRNMRRSGVPAMLCQDLWPIYQPLVAMYRRLAQEARREARANQKEAA